MYIERYPIYRYKYLSQLRNTVTTSIERVLRIQNKAIDISFSKCVLPLTLVREIFPSLEFRKILMSFAWYSFYKESLVPPFFIVVTIK